MLVTNIQLQKFQVLLFCKIFYMKVALLDSTAYLDRTYVKVFTWQQNYEFLLLNELNIVIQNTGCM
jgi:hypothetical protein